MYANLIQQMQSQAGGSAEDMHPGPNAPGKPAKPGADMMMPLLLMPMMMGAGGGGAERRAWSQPPRWWFQPPWWWNQPPWWFNQPPWWVSGGEEGASSSS